jgi:hypothetical protein
MALHAFNMNGAKFKDSKTINKNKIPVQYVKRCNTVAIFANARNEKYIKEWAAHHLLLGFDYIFITDHLSVIPLTHVFNNFDKRVIISNYTQLSPPKTPLMAKAITTARKYKIDWFIYLDADEFIVINHKTITNIKQFLHIYNAADMVGINWLIFGSNFLEKDPPNIIGHYTKSDLMLDKHIKAFVRPNEALSPNTPHLYNIKTPANFFCYNIKMPELTPFNNLNIPFYKAPIYIAHYMIQSKESYYRRKHIVPRDDSGQLRDKNDINNIHSICNSTINLQPKIQYEEKIGKFLQKFLPVPAPCTTQPAIPTDEPAAPTTQDIIGSENTLNANDGRFS